MQCEYRSAREGDVPALRELWKEAFGDGDRFLDQFFEGPFAPERSRVAVVEGAVSGALYWFPASCRGQSLAYLYGVATAARLRGRGLCSGLMADTQAYLSAQGIDGMLLVPGSASLFRFYARLGYAPCCPQGRMKVQAAGPALPLKPVSPRRYGGTPADAVASWRRLPGGGQPGIPGRPIPALWGKEPASGCDPSGGWYSLGQRASLPGPHCCGSPHFENLKGQGGHLPGTIPKGPSLRHVSSPGHLQGPPPAYFGLAFD